MRFASGKKVSSGFYWACEAHSIGKTHSQTLKAPCARIGWGCQGERTMKNPLFVLKKIKCGGCGKLQLSQVCKECRKKNQDIIDGIQETLEN